MLTIKATDTNTYSVTKGISDAETVTASEIIITGTAPSGFALTVDGAGSAANVTLNNVPVDNSTASGKPGMTVKGTVTLTLEGENALSGSNNCAGLRKVDDTKTLTITGSGDLTATGTGAGAGIGGNYEESGNNITFTGTGKITAKGSGAGIGGGAQGSGSNIKIYSGTIEATGGNYSAGIGGGTQDSGSFIYIYNGNITATGGSTGIGGGFDSCGYDIYISGGTVDAYGYSTGIGGGGQSNGFGQNIVISNGNVTAKGNTAIGGGGYPNGGRNDNITISGGSVTAIGTGSDPVIGGTYTGNITISGGSVTVQSSQGTGIGGRWDRSDGPQSVTIKEDAEVRINASNFSSFCWIGFGDKDITAEASAGLTTGHLYGYAYKNRNDAEEEAVPAVALPVYSIKVNDKNVDSYNAKYGILGNTADPKLTFDLTTKKITGNGSFANGLTIDVVNNNDYASNTDLKGKVAVELTNTKKNTSGEYTTGTLTTTGAGDVTVKNNFSYNVTLDDKNITPADQPYDYTKATEGKKLVITPVPHYDLTVTGGKAYADEARTKELRTAENSTVYRTVAGCTVYLKGIAPNDGNTYRFNGWNIVKPTGHLTFDTTNAATSFTMPAEATELAADYVKAYTVTVDGKELKDNSGNTLYFAKGDTVNITSAYPDTYSGTDAPDEMFASWKSNSTDVTFENETSRTTAFPMPDHAVSVETVKKYKVTVTGGKAYTDDANAAAAVIYAKKDDTVYLQYTASGPFKKWNCTNADITPAPGESALPGQASFSMPGQPVAVSAEVGRIPMTKSYGILVQLPEGETFVDGSTPVTVTVTDTPTGAETPDDTNTPSAQTADISSRVFAKAGQTVTLKFDLSSLPVGSEKTFGEWKVVSLAPAQPDNPDGTDTAADGDPGSIVTTPVTVTSPGSASNASFVMPAAPVVVTFTLSTNTLPTPDEPAGGSEPSIAGRIVAGALIGGATYLVGTDFWLNCLYGFLPTNRIQLAEALWNKADCPAPVSAELYPDIDEDDTDAQAAARWCVEQGLMKDYSGTDKDGSEEVTFKPCGYVFRPQAIKAWYDLEKLLNEQQ